MNNDVKLDADEQEIIDNLDKVKPYSARVKAKKMALYKKAAESYLKKGKRINIRIYEGDLERLKLTAAQKGMPYQTLVTSILHQFATGQFTSK